MRNNRLKLPYFAAVMAIFLVISCSQFNKVTDFITNPSARELYEREFEESPETFAIWEEVGKQALRDSITVHLPYAEIGVFRPEEFPTYSYQVAIQPGQQFKVELKTSDTSTRVFIDLYQHHTDSVTTYEHLGSAKPEALSYRTEIVEPGVYQLVIQPEIYADSPFQLQLSTEPVYQFPVAGATNAAIQSLWGAQRDGGRRSHEGVDIFAPRGTPVVAATNGWVSSTGNKGLGGKQVWVRDQDRRQSLYYAHLDSIIARPGMRVQAGDTLGLVGNTGNARTTPPHLHFGIYKRGAIDPLPFVYQNPEPEAILQSTEDIAAQLRVKVPRGNLRSAPTTRSSVLGQVNAQDTLRHLGTTSGWHHIQKGDQKAFVHETLVQRLP